MVYLGGVAPSATGDSKHLDSRVDTGRLLRRASVPTTELRAAMIVGNGSASWQMVRQLADRLPAMILPRWLDRHSWPVSIDDVIYALLATLLTDTGGDGCFELPGPERVTHRAVLEQAATLLGHKPLMVGVPVLTPRLSSYWIALVTSVNLSLARELVNGLTSDLDPVERPLWPRIRHQPMPLVQAIRNALADEASGEQPIAAPARKRLTALVEEVRAT